jgi:hypothetical protein
MSYHLVESSSVTAEAGSTSRLSACPGPAKAGMNATSKKRIMETTYFRTVNQRIPETLR